MLGKVLRALRAWESGPVNAARSKGSSATRLIASVRINWGPIAILL